MKDVFSTYETAEILKVHPNTVIGWCQQGTMKAYKTSPKGHWRITRETLAQYIADNNIAATLPK